MSIIIQNVTKERGREYGKGLQDYVLRINQKTIAVFQHTFEDGLAVCLEKAAAAARDPNRFEIQEEREFLMATFHALGEVRRR